MGVEIVVSVPAYSGFFVETLNNWGVSVLNKQQSVTLSHTHTHTPASEPWEVIPYQGTTGRHNDRCLTVTSAPRLLFIV